MRTVNINQYIERLKAFTDKYGLELEVIHDPFNTYVLIKGTRWFERFEITDWSWDGMDTIINKVRSKYFGLYEPNRKINLNVSINLPGIKQVIFHDPATIIYWADGTRTVVKCQDGDIYDPEKGLAMAISKKALGNKGNYCNVFKHWLPEEDVETLEQRKIDAANKVIQNAFEMWQREHQKDLK